MLGVAIVCCAFLVNCSYGVHIIWDKNAVTNFHDVDTRMEEVRVANWLFIYPGTKWCGAGNIADNEDDLGKFSRTDKCCRNHDNCKDLIEGYQMAHNLTNDAFYSRLHCSCDIQFLQCLKSVNTRDSIIIGNIYFNALGTQCFKEEFPVSKCSKRAYFPRKKCVKYLLDETKEKLYQWFDVPVF